KLEWIEDKLDDVQQQIDKLQQTSIARNDWIDLCARLDIVEQGTNQTLAKVRSRLDSFTKEIRHIAVVPEDAIHQMNDMMRNIRNYLQTNTYKHPQK
ncbi:MAG: hypothetical protein AAGJ35_08840, partial [Myxococcota bacterium]